MCAVPVDSGCVARSVALFQIGEVNCRVSPVPPLLLSQTVGQTWLLAERRFNHERHGPINIGADVAGDVYYAGDRLGASVAGGTICEGRAVRQTQVACCSRGVYRLHLIVGCLRLGAVLGRSLQRGVPWLVEVAASRWIWNIIWSYLFISFILGS